MKKKIFVALAYKDSVESSSKIESLEAGDFKIFVESSYKDPEIYISVESSSKIEGIEANDLDSTKSDGLVLIYTNGEYVVVRDLKAKSMKELKRNIVKELIPWASKLRKEGEIHDVALDSFGEFSGDFDSVGYDFSKSPIELAKDMYESIMHFVENSHVDDHFKYFALIFDTNTKEILVKGKGSVIVL